MYIYAKRVFCINLKCYAAICSLKKYFFCKDNHFLFCKARNKQKKCDVTHSRGSVFKKTHTYIY